MNGRVSDRRPAYSDNQPDWLAKALEKVNARHAETLKTLTQKQVDRSSNS